MSIVWQWLSSGSGRSRGSAEPAVGAPVEEVTVLEYRGPVRTLEPSTDHPAPGAIARRPGDLAGVRRRPRWLAGWVALLPPGWSYFPSASAFTTDPIHRLTSDPDLPDLCRARSGIQIYFHTLPTSRPSLPISAWAYHPSHTRHTR
jgi:hypothetical protein